jgi:mRNA-degrading endonuclease RelE of RelBE toxin-antitoxin system
MKVQTTRPFDRDYAGLPEEFKERVDKQLALLMTNPRHPSLQLKRIRGTADIWEVRVTAAYRLTLQVAGDTYILRRVGPHDVLRQP